ncbi:FAD-dependent oxidoreductase [Methylobacterium terricola]|uniref:FAD-dependent oxidoreductase n=1 Tax=Methylobacterium terricola TaxID=2583531 RepID=A0A5C4L726_9HYPH|nr:NAD(P)/FAD-dependent oxidoreductase [Methylobacterium terricola]TNC04919.1 FAD-dependent oxidoreductase [Methylobacterium terricola]
MSVETIDTLVVGAGQAGVAMSEHLTKQGVPHLVLERARIAERWRTARWDSLVANGPAWHDRFPGLDFAAFDEDAFVPKDQVAEYFAAYARAFGAPIRCGVDVIKVRRLDGRPGFRVETSHGAIEATTIVSATGAFQKPVIPPIVPAEAGPVQLHSNAYRNPAALPPGAILVVGAGSSGVQIADELLRAGRRVYLSVGPHDRPPRAYRGRDFVWWLGVLGKWDIQARAPGTEHVTIAVSGAHGGETIDFRRLAHRGMTLVGRTTDCRNGVLSFAPDLAATLVRGDAYYLALLDEADAYAARNGLDLPQETEARVFLPDPACVTDPIERLDLAQAGISAIIWATGYTSDFTWLEVDAFDEQGRPDHQRGISREPGIYFLGLPWLSGRASSFIWGVWHDARHLADHIATRRSYLDHHVARCRRASAVSPAA